MNPITWMLLVAFVIVFLGTALVTLLGIAGKLPVKEGYLKMFASGLLLEVAAAMIWAFKSQDMSSEAQKFRQRVAEVDFANIDPNCKTPEQKLDALLKGTHRVWTVTGWTEFQDGMSDLNVESVYINSVPFKRLEPSGSFSVDVVEQSLGAGMVVPDLVIDQADPNYKYSAEFVLLSGRNTPTYKFTKHYAEHTITIDEPIKIKKKTKALGTTAPPAVPVLSAPTPPPPSPVLSTPSPSP